MHCTTNSSKTRARRAVNYVADIVIACLPAWLAGWPSQLDREFVFCATQIIRYAGHMCHMHVDLRQM